MHRSQVKMCPSISDEADTQTLETITSLAHFISLDDIPQNLQGQNDSNFLYIFYVIRST